MNSKHDILSGAITLVFMVLVGLLVMTGHDTGAIGTGIVGGMSMVLGYWFTRSGVITGQQTTQPIQEPTVPPTVDPVQVASQVVEEMKKITPPTSVTPVQTNETNVQSHAGN